MVDASIVSGECAPALPVIVQGSKFYSVNGISSASELIVDCQPNGMVKISWTASIPATMAAIIGIPGSIDDYGFTNSSVLTFRNCEDGEILISDVCRLCPEGSYSFHYDPSVTQCSPCPPEAQICEGKSMVLFDGYWRRFNDSDDIFECPMGSSACIGNAPYSLSSTFYILRNVAHLTNS